MKAAIPWGPRHNLHRAGTGLVLAADESDIGLLTVGEVTESFASSLSTL
jgi:hypothetical protein